MKLINNKGLNASFKKYLYYFYLRLTWVAVFIQIFVIILLYFNDYNISLSQNGFFSGRNWIYNIIDLLCIIFIWYYLLYYGEKNIYKKNAYLQLLFSGLFVYSNVIIVKYSYILCIMVLIIAMFFLTKSSLFMGKLNSEDK